MAFTTNWLAQCDNGFINTPGSARIRVIYAYFTTYHMDTQHNYVSSKTILEQVVQCHTKPKNGDFLTADVYLLTSFYPSRVIFKAGSDN